MTTPNLACFHCGLPIYSRENRTEIAGIEQSFCCMGCLAAATTIEGCGLSDFYKYRQSYNDNAESYNLRQNSESLAYDNLTIQKSFVTSNPDNTLSFSLQIEGITCAACVWLIEHSLLKLDGLHQVVLNLSTHRLSIILESDTTPLSEIFNHIQALGYGAKPWKPGNHDHLDKLQKDFLIRIGISGIGLMQVMMNTFAMYLGDIELQHETILRWASLFLTLPVVLYAAAPFYKAAIRDLKSRHFGMDIPVSLALILAFIPSVWATIQQSGDTYYESVVMFTFFLLLGRYLEFRTRLHLDNFNNGIDDLIPALAHKYDNELVIDTPSINLNPGDVIEIRPGEQIPADGIVIEGNSQINEASITGEFKPVIATVDYLVKAGKIGRAHV